MRTLIDLPDQHIKALNTMSKQRKVSRAALVREAVSSYLDSQSRASRNQSIESVFGMWKDRDLDGLAYQKKIRSEWER